MHTLWTAGMMQTANNLGSHTNHRAYIPDNEAKRPDRLIPCKGKEVEMGQVQALYSNTNL